jgi:hypothetical protein
VKKATLISAIVALLTAMVLPAASAMAGDEPPKQFNLVSGWYKDRQVKYYDFGANTPLDQGSTVQTAPIYVFIHGMNADGTPDFVEGQHNIVDVVPGDEGYSDLWQVMLVTVPEDYEPDSIQSKADLDAANFEITETDMFVNCPIVPAGSTLEGGRPLTQGWYKGEEVFYPDFGANNTSAIPIYVMIHGMNADGTPDFVEGQMNIIDSVPGDPGYSAFWQVMLVTVPADYEPNSIRSREDVVAAGFPVTTTDMVVNCPVTEVAAATPGGDAGAGGEPVTVPATGTGAGGDNGTETLTLAALLGVVALIVAAAGGALAYRRAR